MAAVFAETSGKDPFSIFAGMRRCRAVSVWLSPLHAETKRKMISDRDVYTRALDWTAAGADHGSGMPARSGAVGLTKLAGLMATTEHAIEFRTSSAVLPMMTPLSPVRATVLMTTRSADWYFASSGITARAGNTPQIRPQGLMGRFTSYPLFQDERAPQVQAAWLPLLRTPESRFQASRPGQVHRS